MMDWIESLLAGWTGRANWPWAHATFEDRFAGVPGYAGRGSACPGLIACDFFTYEVEGQTYTVACREVEGHGRPATEPGSRVKIQYNPEHPRKFYYAPACPLASKFVVGIVVLGGALAIVFNVYRVRHAQGLW